MSLLYYVPERRAVFIVLLLFYKGGWCI